MAMERIVFVMQSFRLGGHTREDDMPIFSTFNPSAMSQELIEGSFVQRESLAERLVDIFEESARRESKHNVLLVGPRGIGKSHLLSLVYHRLKAKEDLVGNLCIAYLKEDEWGINSFLDLLLRTLRAVLEEQGLGLSGGVGDFSGLSHEQAEEQVWRSLQKILGRRTLLLIIENLDAVFEKIEEQGQRKWRALMQTNPQWAILATTPALFSAVSRQVSPFYGFFEVIHLQPLSFADAVALLRKLAHLNNDESTATFLDTAVGRARVRAVQHLASGNHRIFVLFYDFLSQGGSEHFVAPLLKTVDALTPYYQSQMAKLSPQQQKIVNFLCEYRLPASVTVIAKSCFATHQTAASQLKQLLTRRYVRVDRIGRESFYELAEPLLRICVEAKTHRERPLDLMVDFIRYWFSREELERRLSDISARDYEKPYLSAALQRYDTHEAHTHLTPDIASLCAALNPGKESPERLRAKAQELAELSKIAEDWPHYTRAMVWLDKEADAIPTLEKLIERSPNDVDLLRSLASAHDAVGSQERARELLDRAITIAPNRGILFFDKGQQLSKMDRNEDALKVFEEAVSLDHDLEIIVAIQRSRLLVRMGRFKDACEAVAPFLPRGKAIPGIFVCYGVALANQERLGEALDYLDKGTEAFEFDANAWGSRGIVLSHLGKYGQALASLERGLALSPDSKFLLHHRCETLLESQQYEKAVETATPEVLSHNVFHQLLKIVNARPKQGELQQKLMELSGAHDSTAWQDAFLGGLTELTNFATTNFKEREHIEVLEVWNFALKELFANQKRFSILLKLFDVLTRVRVSNDRKALLELPREQRLLLVPEGQEEDSLNPSEEPLIN
jgi:tetratricopeptide (TPR) repeat protein